MLSFENDFNTKFAYSSTVHFEELDPMGILHNSRYAARVEHAVTAFYTAQGGRWEREVSRNPDQFHVVRDFRIEFLSPFFGPGTMRIEVWVERLGSTSCIYGFRCLNEDGSVGYARGERTIIKVDPTTFRPLPWSELFRTRHAEIQKDLPAYA